MTNLRSVANDPPPDSSANALQAALDAGLALADPRPLDSEISAYSVTIPAGAVHQILRVPAADARYDASPARATGTYHPATVEALIDIVTRHHDACATTVWVHPTSGNVSAVFNDAAPALPGWRDHRAELNLTVTPEWQHWTSKDGRLLGQVEFAEHVEDGLAEIVEPAAADMLELAQTFHAQTAATFRSVQRLASGQVQVQYDEEITAAAGQSAQMQIPTEFKLAIAPFLGEDPYAVTALLRYRIKSGQLQLGYKLQRPDHVVRDALTKIAERLTSLFPAVFIGDAARS